MSANNVTMTTFLLEDEMKRKFKIICAEKQTSMTEKLHELINNYLEAHYIE